ncbi:tRNA (N6-threonylcarbamoyladenosine(37)-N6)-methyltransferase TrmO [Solidesulfovibrio sp.]|uniref:tRNA (N6-threonylcarbamoyladenosine(37)-N6)-methyltransferase TrmO n=1 Tax=Solidesulfovibrio sp. TaxID=2910990 RepID=UPI002B2027BA|nr:tRNA (N6-threonylcarbamoyladenosine(37)-N6)-methyltransferase TrmO [Solidesulfovibrio sp.]MEA4855730.1 tRNA (N6-threonylcarbamoyladenosine(37)-N6)-methyltransferase TrmO [Solidesulfovibrio sp.]
MERSCTLTPIGVIRSPFTALAGMPIQPGGARETLGRLELDPALAPALADLDGFSHIYLLYLFHASKGYNLTVTPYLDDTPRGLFATRAPKRPNPIGLSVVELVAVEGAVVQVRGVDVLDGTPLLDIKPYAPAFDVPAGPVRSGWLEGRGGTVAATRSDDRFVPPA